MVQQRRRRRKKLRQWAVFGVAALVATIIVLASAWEIDRYVAQSEIDGLVGNLKRAAKRVSDGRRPDLAKSITMLIVNLPTADAAPPGQK